jgi:Tol biopolymer transport system component
MAKTIAIALTIGALGSACGSTSAPVASDATTVTAPTTTRGSTTTAVVATAPPPAGPVIVYEGPIDGGAGNRVVGTDGAGDRWLTPAVSLRSGGWQVHPDWSPDGKRLAFAADSDGDTRDLWVTDADGTNPVRILDCSLPCIEADYPSWSPDGRQLAFEAFDGRGDENANARLAILDVASGKARTVFTAARAGDIVRTPRWSPDGRRLVFEIQHLSNAGPSGKLVGTEIDVTAASPPGHVRRLTRRGMFATYPDWSWKRNEIVFSTRPWSDLPDGPSNLYTIEPDGSRLHAVTRFAVGSTRATQPSWTPDGERIIFTAVEGSGFGSPTMATIRPDGTGLAAATTSGPMFGTHPRLQPPSGR